jgi:hypothetical protein
MPFADFGSSITLIDIDNVVLSALSGWLPTFVRSQERISGYEVGRQRLPGESSYLNALEEIERLPDDRLPAIVAITASTTGEPERDAGGNYSAAYRVVVYSFVRGISDVDVRTQASVFGGAVKRLVTTKVAQSDGPISAVTWDGEAIDPVDDDSSLSRNLAVAVEIFTVWVDDIFSDMSGPVEPDPPEDVEQDYSDYPIVTKVTTTVTAVADE